jgi:hypothetical protein
MTCSVSVAFLRRSLPVVLAMLLLLSSCQNLVKAFQTTPAGIVAINTRTKQQQQQSTSFKMKFPTTKRTTLNMMMMLDPNDAMMTHISTASSVSHETLDAVLLQTQLLLSDASSASSSSDSSGWWSAYLNIFKTALTLVHDTIDGPLRSVGVTQTWGPSIALFTAGEFVFKNEHKHIHIYSMK